MKLVTNGFEFATCRRAVAASLMIAATCVFVIGCGNRRTPPPVQSIGTGQSATDAPDESGSQDALADQSSDESNDAGQVSPDPSAAPDNGPVDRTQLVAVGPEDAKRGSTITGGGIITEPLKQFFFIQHRLVFDQVKYAEKLYKAEHGRMPRSHEDYMKEIINANALELPELDAGWDYYYDTQSEQLMQRQVN